MKFLIQFLICVCVADAAFDGSPAKAVWTDRTGEENSPQGPLLWEMGAFVAVMFDHTPVMPIGFSILLVCMSSALNAELN